MHSLTREEITLMKRTSLLLSLSLGSFLTTAAFGITGAPSEITYTDTAGVQWIYAFATGNNGHLVANYWNGSTWQWADLGLPTGATAVYSPTAITFASGANQAIYVFAAASNGHLVGISWNGVTWLWTDQGLPAGDSAVYYPTAVTYASGANQLIYVFAEASSGHLVVNHWNGSAWQWADQGLPRRAKTVNNPTAITWAGGANQQIYVFAEASNGDLVVNYWTGSAWQWADQGLPAGATAVYTPTAITYASGPNRLIYVFAVSSTGHLVVNHWNGSTWQWADQGLPAGASAVNSPSAITYASGPNQPIFVFAVDDNYQLVVNDWNGSTWQWANQGLPEGFSSLSHPSAVTYASGANQMIYAFVRGNTGALVVNYWNGYSWNWADQGIM